MGIDDCEEASDHQHQLAKKFTDNCPVQLRFGDLADPVRNSHRRKQVVKNDGTGIGGVGNQSGCKNGHLENVADHSGRRAELNPNVFLVLSNIVIDFNRRRRNGRGDNEDVKKGEHAVGGKEIVETE